jgi:hypothetical protein
LQACLAKHRDARPKSADELDKLLARIESTLSRPPGATPGTSKVKVFSTSMFFEPLPLETVDPGATLLPNAGMSFSGGDLDSIAPSVEVAALPRSRRGIYLGVGALLVLAVISVAIGLMMSKKRVPAPPDAAVATFTIDAAPVAIVDVAPAEIDAPAVGPVIDARVAAIDAAVVVRDAPTGGSAERPKNTVALKHLADADALFASKGDPMGQMANAQLAIEADPKNLLKPSERARAHFLLGDGMMRSAGNFERGCKYLQKLKNVVALKHAQAAGCPN